VSAFDPGPEWVDVPPAAVLPAGCEIEMDLASGRQRARRPANLQAEIASFVTVLEELDGRPINKIVTRLPDGNIAKAMAENSGEYMAEILAAPDLATFADIIADLSDSPHKTLMLGQFRGAPDQPFLVMPKARLVDYLKLDPKNHEAVLGFHLHPNGTPMVARLKENAAFGGWLLFDRDAVAGMPEELASLSRDDWLDAMDALLPGFKACRRLTLPSTSSRITVDGRRLEASSYHVFVQVTDPHDIPRVWGQLLPKALVTPAPLPSWKNETMLGFQRPKYDRHDRSMVVAYQPWSIFDPSTGQTNRLVFDGSPVVRGNGLAVVPAEFEMHDGEPLDLSSFENLTTEQIDELESVTKLKVSLSRGSNGSGVHVTGISTTSPTLSLSLEVETERGWLTIKQLVDQAVEHTRCQSPFRESTSWAAYYNTHADGTPFLFDSGTNTKYVLPDEQTGDAIYDLSHDGLALHMGKRWAKNARHVALWGKWLFWSGSRWLVDEKLRHMTLTRDYLRKRADDLVRDTKSGKIKWGDKDPKQAVAAAEAIAKSLRAGPVIASVASLARSNAELVASVEQWDGDAFKLGTGTLTCQLRTGATTYPVPADYITKVTAVAPAPAGSVPHLWLSFLDRVTDGDKELQAYLRRAAGYCLTGSIREHVLFFLHGTGANGKSVFVNTLVGIWHDYAVTFPTELLMVANHDRHPTEIARLRGSRLAMGSEVEIGRTWAETRVKMFTGGDRLQGRFMRQDFFEFDAQFKLMIVGNNKPSLRGVDEAIRRRLHLIPFTVTIPVAERDHDLPEKLKAEWPAIMRWCLDGCFEWQQIGLKPPERVLAATRDYLAGEDTFERWREDCTTPDPHSWESSGDLWASWQAWAGRTGEHPGKQRAFSQLLEERGLTPEKQGKASIRGYRGLRINRVDYTQDPRTNS
jgi:putative DNA primase/helicase